MAALEAEVLKILTPGDQHPGNHRPQAARPAEPLQRGGPPAQRWANTQQPQQQQQHPAAPAATTALAHVSVAVDCATAREKLQTELLESKKR